jgi:CubicO group peptidase (beta-lactamase class C family)
MEALRQVDEWPCAHVAVGVAGRLEGTHGDVDRDFAWASVTKLASAVAILVAAEEGLVDLDEDAGPPGSTLRHLLAHASGVAFDRPLRSFPPGHRRVYSNVGIEMAADHVAAAAGMPFAQYFSEALVGPLQLSGTTLPGSPASGAVASVADLARVAHELLSPTGLVSTSTIDDLATVQYPGLRGVLPGWGMRDPNDWGLGFEIRHDKTPHWTGTANSPATYGHFGQSGTFVWVDPEARLALVALTDRDFDEWARTAWPQLSDAVLAAY